MFKTASAIGTPTETVWAQVHTVDNLIITVVVETDEGTNVAAAGKEFLIRIENLYQESRPNGLATFRSFLHKVLEEHPSTRLLCLTAALLVGKVLYIGATHGAVFLKREGRLQLILEAESELSTASGFVQEGDIVILASDGLTKEIREAIEEIVTVDDATEIAEGLLAKIHKADGKEKLVGLVATIPQAQIVIAPEESTANLPTLQISFLRQTGRKLLRGQSKRVILTVFVLLIVLLAASLVLGVGKRRQEEEQARFAKVRTEVLQKYDEGVALSDLNPILAQKTFRQAQALLEKEKPSFSQKSNEYKELSELGKKIDEGLHKALRIYTVSDPAIFFDVTVIKEGAIGKSVSSFEEKMLILDGKENALYSVTIPGKRGELVSGNIVKPTHEALSPDFAYVLSEGGIERIALSTKKRELVIKKDDAWGEIGAVANFIGNLYLLDKSNGAIYKYQGLAAEKRNYLAADVKPDFTSSVNMAIDGAIWILFADGRISKFAQGAPLAFSIDGLDMPLGAPVGLFTDDETEHLYILDRGHKRVVVVKKDGTYLSQYRWEGIGEVSDLVVSEKEKKIFLLSGSKIYEIELRMDN